MAPPNCVPCGRDFHPVTTQPKGANQWLKSLQPNELPLVLRARPAAAGAARHSRAAKSNPSPRRTEAKKIWTWRRNNRLHPKLACASGGESHHFREKAAHRMRFSRQIKLSFRRLPNLRRFPSAVFLSFAYRDAALNSTTPAPGICGCRTLRFQGCGFSPVSLYRRASLACDINAFAAAVEV